MKKLAVVFPGIGYHKDKPLLYYARKLAVNMGYDVMNIEYHDMPQKIKGDAAMMKKAAEIAFLQTEEQLEAVRFEDFEEVVFIGKSIGTVALAKYAADHGLNVKQIWYTPVEATFSFGSQNVVAFIGDEDPWSDVETVKETALNLGITLYSYPGCNHSLESADIDKNIVFLRDVIQKTEAYICLEKNRENSRI